MISEALPLSPTRFTFILGVLVGMKLYEVRHITTGSLVVPGFIAAYIIAPMTIVVTMINALVTQAIMKRVLDRFVLLYGRQRFVTTSAIAVILGLISTSVVTPLTNGILPPIIGIGYVVPALIAHDINRAGAKTTVGAIVFTGAVTTLPALALGATFDTDPIFTSVKDLGLSELPDGWLPILVVITTLVVPVSIDRRRLRTGGFISAVYVALWAARPLQLVFVLVAALVTFALVDRLKRFTILFGRRKFSAMLVVGGMINWFLMEAVIAVFGPEHLPMASLPLAPVFIPCLLANDMERGSVVSTAVGAGVVGAFSFSFVTVLIGLVDGDPIPLWAAPVAIATGAFLFQERVSQLANWLVGNPVRPIERVELLHEN